MTWRLMEAELSDFRMHEDAVRALFFLPRVRCYVARGVRVTRGPAGQAAAVAEDI